MAQRERNILIIDEDKNMGVIKEYLENNFLCKVLIAKNARSAIKIIKGKKRIHVVIMEIIIAMIEDLSALKTEKEILDSLKVEPMYIYNELPTHNRGLSIIKYITQRKKEKRLKYPIIFINTRRGTEITLKQIVMKLGAAGFFSKGPFWCKWSDFIENPDYITKENPENLPEIIKSIGKLLPPRKK